MLGMIASLVHTHRVDIMLVASAILAYLGFTVAALT